MKVCILAIIALLLATIHSIAQQPIAADFKLRSTLIDTYPKEHLLAIRVDTMSRLFVGARDSLFVYEPKKDGSYEPRKIIYRFPSSSWINDIEVHGDNLYVLTSNALYVFVDGVRKRSDLLPRKLIWGVPVGVPHRGFSKLAWGPEGDLYFALGGPAPFGMLAYWTFFSQPEGAKLPYRGVGGVFRCKPDGSDLRLVAEGLRNPAGLTFDREWNLFACDILDKSQRFVHVTPHARLTELVSLGDSVGTPGPWYVDEPALPQSLRNRLMFFSHGDYWCHVLTPTGATFKSDAPITMPDGPGAVSIGCGGEIFALVSQSEVRRLTNADDPKAHAFEPYEASEVGDARLWQELSSASWQRRSRAHLEITRRGGDLLKEANKRLNTAKVSDPALPHLIWLAAKSQQGSLHLLSMMQHAEPKMRLQAIRALTEFPEQLREEPIFTKALIDTPPILPLKRGGEGGVRLAAVEAYFHPKVGFDAAIQKTIERGPAMDSDPRLHQLAALLLAQKGTQRQIEGLCASVDPALREAGVRIAGYRLTLPPRGPIAPHLPLGETPHLVTYADGEVDLRTRGRVGVYRAESHWKADMHTVEQELLFKLLVRMLNDDEKTVRVQAANFLVQLGDVRCDAAVKKVLAK
jgi:hypothetical protein